jgi:hypothetical protein
MATCQPDANEAPSIPEIPASVPEHVGKSDVTRIETATELFRTGDYQRGGGGCHDAVVAYLAWAQRLLRATATDPVALRLHSAVSDLHSLAGWTAFDIGRIERAHHHFGEAISLARSGHNEALVACVGYRRGRIHLHHNAAGKASADFRLGRQAARGRESALAAAILHANEGWVAAKTGLADDALTSLGESMDEFTRSDPADTPRWAAFFDTNELLAMSGVIYTELAQSVDPAFARSAIPALTAAVDGYGQGMARSRSLSLIALATSHLIDHDADRAAAVGAEAIAIALTVKSSRTRDRLLSLKSAADQRGDNADARDLAERIAAFAAMSPGCSWAATPPERTCLSHSESPCTTVWRPSALVE